MSIVPRYSAKKVFLKFLPISYENENYRAPACSFIKNFLSRTFLKNTSGRLILDFPNLQQLFLLFFTNAMFSEDFIHWRKRENFLNNYVVSYKQL